jgi:hypothetical protein
LAVLNYSRTPLYWSSGDRRDNFDITDMEALLWQLAETWERLRNNWEFDISEFDIVRFDCICIWKVDICLQMPEKIHVLVIKTYWILQPEVIWFPSNSVRTRSAFLPNWIDIVWTAFKLHEVSLIPMPGVSRLVQPVVIGTYLSLNMECCNCVELRSREHRSLPLVRRWRDET